MRKVLIVILWTIVIAACDTKPSLTITESPPTNIRSTITPRPTVTPYPPPTRRPTHTPIVLPSPTPDEEIQVTRESSQTPFLLKLKFPKACSDEFSDYYMKISPDENWLAEYCFSENRFQVSNQDGSKIYRADFTEIIHPVHWTLDSQHIYFTATAEAWMDGANFSISELAPNLYRLSISNGEISQILSGIFYHSFSPTDRRMIEVQEYKHPVKLIVHDLKTGKAETIIPTGNPKYSQAGNIIWSPDGLKFVFVAALGNEYGDEVSEPNIQSLIMVDLDSSSQRVIISEIPDFIEPISWSESNAIVYKVMNYLDRYQITFYSYDYQHEEIQVLSTATP